MKQILRFFLLSSLPFYCLFAAINTGMDKQSFLVSDLGIGYTNFRDTGTSPLRYLGPGLRAGLGFQESGSRYEWGFKANLGYSAEFAQEYYLLHHIQGGFELFYIYTLLKKQSAPVQVQAGLHYSSRFGAAVNTSYSNASFNADLFNGFHLRSGIKHVFSRPPLSKKILFIPVRRPLRHYSATFTLDMPLLLINMRPEYAYVIDGNEPLVGILSRHVYIGGFYLRSETALSRILPNGNAVRLAYVWEMFSSGKRDIYRLETAAHILQCSFYFRVK